MLRCINKRLLLALGASALSGFFLASAFPMPPALAGMEGGSAAWLALVPLLLLLPHVSPKQGAFWGGVAGSVFHLIGLSWLLALRITWGNTLLSVLAWIGLSLYCALYVAGFSYLYATYATKWMSQGLRGRLQLLVLTPVLWVGLEFLRSILFTGFPWNLLGASQYQNPVLMQPARVAGVYGISFLIVLFNTALALTVQRIWREVLSGQKRRRIHVELMVGLLALATAWSMGVRSLSRVQQLASDDPQGLRMAVVQPSIPQVQKWSEEHSQHILSVLREQTSLALMSDPDVVVWPETATPGMVRFDPESRALVEEAVSEGASLLVGTMDMDPDTREYFNSALLVTPNKRVEARYDKRHLVPFGEYVPLTSWFPFLERFAPLGFSCTPGPMGQEPISLPAQGGDIAASVLICFEDVFPYLARRDVRNGAQILVNVTNDGWFDGSSAARQHLALAVVRAVENQVPMVRAANTGVSAFIDQVGRIKEVPGPYSEGRTGWGARGVVVLPAGEHLTLYTRFGDWLLAIPCVIGTVLSAIWIVIDGRRKKRN